MTRAESVLILGCGVSGAAAARLLRAEGARVYVVDSGDSPALRTTAELLEKEQIEVTLNAGETLPSRPFDWAVVSPGIACDSRWVRELKQRGAPVFSELEVGWRRRTGRILAVTGSNGKSTAVKWIAEALNRAGFKALPGGNYGMPISEIVMTEPKLDWLVLEVSSFQLETVQEFRAELGLLLNVQPNHLDRHKDFETYLRTKARLFAKSLPEDVCVVHESVASPVQQAASTRGRWLTFGAKPPSDFRFSSGWVQYHRDEAVDLRGTYFDNEILGQNAAGVVGVLISIGVSSRVIEETARAFRPLPHRMQCIAEIGGVRFVDDSKATNLTAMAAAMKMAGGPVRLIAGGLLKERDLSTVKSSLREHARAVYLIGHAARVMAEAWHDTVRCVLCETLENAVARAACDAQPGETVLLAPACTSFDQFHDFKERGESFARAVQNLLERKACEAHKPSLAKKGENS